MKREYGTSCYRVAELREGVFQIEEFGVYCYLVCGTEQALLIDTGTGFGDLAQLAASLTELPLTVCATHAHPDHIGGRGAFRKLYLPKRDRRIARFYGSLFARRAMFGKGAQAKYKVTRRDVLRGKYRTKYLPLTDGDAFSLGGRTVRAVVTPGHTKGSTVFLCEPDRLLFTGDNACRGIWLFLPGATTAQEWLAGARRILALEEAGYAAYGAHEAEPQEPALLARLIATCEELVRTRKNTFFPHIRVFPKDYVDHAVVYRTTRVQKRGMGE